MSKKFVVILSILLFLISYFIYSYSLIPNFFKNQVLSYYGSRGDEVVTIQKKLKTWNYFNGPVDGIYGAATYKAVRYFQSRNGLTVDGVAGTRTLKALGINVLSTNSNTTSTANLSKDADLLAHIINGEARGEPYVGKVAVGSVIINRTTDSRFPKTLAGVIYQPGAFDAVSDGQINLTPNNDCIKAAKDALNGWDPVETAVYYFNPNTATNKWIWSREVVATIGNHIFAK